MGVGVIVVGEVQCSDATGKMWDQRDAKGETKVVALRPRQKVMLLATDYRGVAELCNVAEESRLLLIPRPL